MARQPGTQVGDGKVKLGKARAGARQSIQDGGLTDDDGQREVLQSGT